MALVAAVFVSFVVLLVKVAPQWNKVFLGFVPSETLFHTDPDALYIAVGILGATVMPHALFLGSYLATQDRVSSPVQPLPQPAASSNGAHRMGFRNKLITWASSLFAVSRPERRAAPRAHVDKYGRENNDLGFIRAHLSHGLVDVIVSLLAVAVPINSAILVIAAAVFFTSVASQSNAPAGLFDAHDLIKERISNGAAFIFALALLCAGQTASITATLAGQIVSEGFIEWRVSPFLRRIITRLIGLVPSMVVAIAVGRNGINTLLVASQVALAIVLPFVAFPLIWLTSSKSVMSVRKPVAPSEEIIQSASTMPSTSAEERAEAITEIPGDECQPPNSQLPEKSVMEKREDIFEMRVKVEEGYVSFASSRLVTLIASLIFLVIVAANFYVVVVLAMGGTA
ncbi:Manganese transporter SMF2 [Grifola frondosa]|uniref:Manganese transporter SMF2 n=1 Tax=Grifola frondosa TaxID=5627 RepID=A0A1C7MSL1_GRIFR|nr:Manganese transporter SMF2 [Grifola frondosa]